MRTIPSAGMKPGSKPCLSKTQEFKLEEATHFGRDRPRLKEGIRSLSPWNSTPPSDGDPAKRASSERRAGEAALNNYTLKPREVRTLERTFKDPRRPAVDSRTSQTFLAQESVPLCLCTLPLGLDIIQVLAIPSIPMPYAYSRADSQLCEFSCMRTGADFPTEGFHTLFESRVSGRPPSC